MTQATLAEVASLITDGTHASPLRTATGVPVLSAQNIKDGRLLMETDRFTSVEELAAFEKRVRPQAGDLLLTIVGTIGRAALLAEAPSAVFQRSVAILRPRVDKIDARYFLHATRSPSFVEQLRRATNQSSQAGVYLGKLGKLTVPLPSLSEQRRIAAMLDQAECLCAKRQQALQCLNDLIPSVYFEMFGSGEFPERPLGELVDSDDRINYGVVQPGVHVEDGVPLIRVSDLRGGVVDRSGLKRISAEIEAKYRRSRIRGTEILVSCVGSVGVVALVSPEDIGANVARAVTRVPISDHDFRSYVAAVLSSPRVQRYFKSELRTVSQPTLNGKQIAETAIPVPPVEMVKQFAIRLEALEPMRLSLEMSMRELHELRSALMVRAFGGQV